mgnify:CR=1 FL=1
MTTLMGKRQTPVTRYCYLKHQSSFNAKVPSTPKFVQRQSAFNAKVRSTPKCLQRQSSFNNEECTTPKFAQHQSLFNTKVCSTPKSVQNQSLFNTEVKTPSNVRPYTFRYYSWNLSAYGNVTTWHIISKHLLFVKLPKKTFYVPLFVHALIIYKYYVFAYLPKTNIKWSIKWATLFNVLLLSGMNVSSVLI